VVAQSGKNFKPLFFYVLLTVHLSITLANDQPLHNFFNTFITILYMYMFRAICCSSSGGQIVLIQHLASSLSVSDRPYLSITLANDQPLHNFFNTFITIFYVYMFRAICCSSSGGQIVLIQHLASSLSVSDRPVHSAGRSHTESDDTRCCINTI